MGTFSKNFKNKIAAKLAREGWGTWERVDYSKAPKAIVPKGLTLAYRNNIFSVQVYERKISGTDDKALLAGIRCHLAENSHKMTWAQKQRIKNEIFGAERVAFEVYPPESELVDQSDMYWIWIMPAGTPLPFKLFDAQQKRRKKPTTEKGVINKAMEDVIL